MRTKLFIIIALSLTLISKGQENSVKKDLKAADDAYERADFLNAYRLYSKVLKCDTGNYDVYFKAGVCLFGMNKMDTASLKYFEKAKAKVPESHFFIGKIYQLKGYSKRALDELYYFKSINTEEEVDNGEVNHWINMCETAIKETARKESFLVKNLGEGINTNYPEYVPLVWSVNGSLIFTSRRNGSTGGLKDPYGRFYEDIYIAQKTGQSWTKPEPLSNEVNTETHDACVALSPSGTDLLIYRTDAKQTGGDIYISHFDGTKWSAPEMLGPEINSEFLEASACFSADGNEIIFSSNRPGGFGGKDLYRVRRFMNGKFSLPYNLGPGINSREEEDAPFIDKNDNTLYFSSRGHNSMGEYDIFRSAYDSDNFKWLHAENLGAPINSTNDDIYFMKLDDKPIALFSSRREGGFGDADIYEINFEESTQLIIYCKLNSSLEKDDLKDVQLSLFDTESGKLEGIYRPNKNYFALVLVVTDSKPYKLILEGSKIDPIVKNIVFTPADRDMTLEVTGKTK
jgi:hypothetical protein